MANPPVQNAFANQRIFADGACILRENAMEPENIMMWKIRLYPWAREQAAPEYIIGPLPANPVAADIAYGKRILLKTIESLSFKQLLLGVQNNISGPAIIAWIQANMLDARDTQEVLNSMLDTLPLDIATTPLVSFLGDFSLIVAELNPALPERTKCLKFSMKFPVEFLSIIAVCDGNPGTNNFMAYALALITKGNLYMQRIQLSQRGRTTSMPGLITDVQQGGSSSNMVDDPLSVLTSQHPYFQDPNARITEGTSQVTREAMSAMIDSNDTTALVTMLSRLDPTIITEALAAAVQRRGGRGGPNFNYPKDVCINCGNTGHLSNACTRPNANCPHPICQERGIKNHMLKFCAESE